MNEGQPRVLVLSWHPEEGSITAGGFRRAAEVVSGLAAFTHVLAVDCSPTIFRCQEASSMEIVQYSVPHMPRIARVEFRLARLIQWMASTWQLMRVGTRMARRNMFDVVYVPTSELLPCALAGVLIKARSRRPLVMCNQNIEGVFLPRLIVALHNRADLVTTVSASLAASLRAAGVKTPVRVTRNGVPTKDLGDVAPREREIWDALFIGRHTQEKGIFDLLDIWERVSTESPGVRLALLGACQPRTEERIIERCNRSEHLRHQVSRLGVLTEEAKISALKHSRVLVAPSRVEGWGFAPLEALLCGVPVVCWDLRAYRESLPNGPAVSRVPVGDIDLFADAVTSLLRLSRSRRQELLSNTPVLPAISWDDVSRDEWEAVRDASENGR